MGNKSIALKNCRNVVLRDFSILKGGHFGLLLTGVDNLTIDNLKIDTDRDGMDLDCCRNARVSNCSINSPWDDAICPKSSFALGYARASENISITNCCVTGNYELGSMLDGTFKKFDPGFRVPRTGRIKFGTESNGGFGISRFPIVFSKDARGWPSRPWMEVCSKTCRSVTSLCAKWSCRSLCGLAAVCAVLRESLSASFDVF